MAIYHLSGKVFSRSKGESAIGKAAYRSGEDLYDVTIDKTFNYAHRESDIAYKAILTPEDVPEWATDRQELWTQVEYCEKRKDAQLAREFVAALPCELSLDKDIELITKFVQDNFVAKGMIADVAIHDADSNNPHAHIMLTMREISTEGFGKKNRGWNSKKNLESWRESWGNLVNDFLEDSGSNERVDHRTLEAQKIDRKPTIHMGVHATHMENKGFKTWRGDLNRTAKAINEKMRAVKTLIIKLGGGMLGDTTRYLQSLPSLIQLQQKQLALPSIPRHMIGETMHHGRYTDPPDMGAER